MGCVAEEIPSDSEQGRLSSQEFYGTNWKKVIPVIVLVLRFDDNTSKNIREEWFKLPTLKSTSYKFWVDKRVWGASLQLIRQIDLVLQNIGVYVYLLKENGLFLLNNYADDVW